MVVLPPGPSSVCALDHAVEVYQEDIDIVEIHCPRTGELTAREMKSKLNHASNNHVQFTEHTVNGVHLDHAQPLVVLVRSHA